MVRLGARGLTRRFGPVVANDGIDFAVAPATIHAIVGGNGAGKSTLMRILQGVDQPDEGEVILNDEPVRLAGPADAFQRGVGLVHQEFRLAPPLSLLENLILAREPMARGLIDRRAALRAAMTLAAVAGVRLDWRMRVADAPVHVRQILEILRLLYRGADVLILDEPTAVLAPAQILELLALMRKLKGEGRTLLFVSHKLEEVLSVADAVTVMRAGRVVLTTTPSETSAEALAEAMVGEPVATPRLAARSPHAGGAPILSARGLVGRDALGARRLGPVDLDIFPGEIVGVAGVGGNGQDELVASVAGVAAPAAGSLSFAGAALEGAAAFRAAGVGYVSSDRAEEGLCQTAALRDNFIAGREAAFARNGVLRGGAIRERARAALAALNVRYGRLSDPASTLSGGNQQRLVFARELDRAPKLLVAAQPTRGVDIAGSAFIHSELAAFRDRGGAVLLVSESLGEVLALSDRVIAIYNGGFVGELPRGAATVEAVGRMMLGAKGGMSVAARVAAVAPFLLALAIGAAILAATGHEPLGVYRLMFVEAFGGERRFAATLTAATPLLLTGLAAAVAFRAGVFNVGAEGCFYLGGLIAAVAGYGLAGWPAAALIPTALLLAALVGGAWMILPGALRVGLGVDEVVTTLMLNFIAIGLTNWLVNGPLLARGSANSATPAIAASAELPLLAPPTTLHLGFVISLALVLAYGLWGRLTVGGFRSRLVGLNPRFSRAVGIEANRVVFAAMVASGGIGGLAGGIHTLGLVHRFVAGFSPGYGFTGIAIALLARNSALGVALASVLFGALTSAGANIQLFSDVPIEIVEILQGVVMIFAVAQFGWRRGRAA